MSQAHTWLQNCLHSHKKCQMPSTTSGFNHWYPTRLLEIDQPVEGYCRLLATTSLLSQEGRGEIKYASLSYCWGNSKVFMLTSQTMPRLESGIPIADLGRTSGDSVLIARQLNIPMIWIDSLCIVQDSKDDWMCEAPKMTNVYRNAVLNIAAVAASHSDCGCWPSSNSIFDSVDPLVVILEGSNIRLRGQYAVFDTTMSRDAFDKAPLLRRAWVMQELCLARRVLYFCEKQLFWGCGELEACETCPDGFPSEIWDSELSEMQWLDIEPGRAITTRNNALGTPLNTLWEHTVGFFTKRSLTFPSDKLVAISGLAKLCQEAFHADYVAGLWRHNLELQLIWFTTSCCQQTRYPPQTYRAPTWSWASIDVAVNGLGDTTEWEPVIRVHDCHIQTRTEDTTVDILDGYLRLSGCLITVKIPTDEDEPDFQLGSRIFVNNKWAFGIAFVRLDCNMPSLDRVHALPVAVDKRKDQPPSVFLLLLQPTDKRKGWFYRIGIMHKLLKGLGIEGDDYSALRHMSNESWLEYESIDSKRDHLVVIV